MDKICDIATLLHHGTGSREAIGAPGRKPMTRSDLAKLARELGGALGDLGLTPYDRIAIVMPNGPEMAALFVALSCWAGAAPLNPNYREDEFEFYLSDLEAKAIFIEAGMDSPARQVAARRAIPIVELSPDLAGPAGAFKLSVPMRERGAPEPAADQIALILHTSGTTSRPKIVPLTHGNLAASADNIVATLALQPSDRCLAIMPLFHIHGLVGALLASLRAQASVHCPPGFNALKFFGWLDETQATWYTAVPTMHQAVLARADRNADILKRRRLRFIRSSSASLPPPVMRALEEVFGCPVIESYGMTEASHQMASNPLPPSPRKPGSVGVAAGPEVAIMDQAGRFLAAGQPGEIVIRGANVTKGYANNPAANAEAFINGWFRTGDQGVMDEDGYLTITGRLKEIINRGGEKISPREVDDALMEHPAVAQAVTFALPHEKLGEDVAAAIVLKEGKSASEAELRQFVARRLADFKTPRKIVFLDEIPKGATGKLQRIGLAKRLGLVT